MVWQYGSIFLSDSVFSEEKQARLRIKIKKLSIKELSESGEMNGLVNVMCEVFKCPSEVIFTMKQVHIILFVPSRILLYIFTYMSR